MRHLTRLKKSVVGMLMFAVFVSTLAVTTPGDKAHAVSMTEAPKLDIMSEGAPPIGPEYSFVPQVTSATAAKPFGSTLWRMTQWSAGDARKFHSIEVTNPTNRDSLKGKIGMRYTNVGTYDGKAVDLKITVTGWSRYGNVGKSGTAAPVGNISFESKKIAMSTQGFNYVDTSWEYLVAGTNTPIYVSGYFTFSDIDLYQGIAFSPTTSRNIERYMIEDRNNKLQFSTYSTSAGTQHKIHDNTDKDIPDEQFESDHAFTWRYKDLRSFSLRWQTDWSKSRGGSISPSRYYYGNTTNYAVGEYMFFVINKPGGETPAPEPEPDPPVASIDTIQIFTNNVTSDGLRTIVDFGDYASDMDADDYDSRYANFEVFDRTNNRTVYTDSRIDIENLPRAYEFEMPAHYLAKGAKTRYEFKLTIPKKKTQYRTKYGCHYYWTDHDNDPETPTVQRCSSYSYEVAVTPIPKPTPISMFTYGWTSSEKHFTVADLSYNELKHKAVIKTIAGSDGSYGELFESMSIKFPILRPIKTGYEFGPAIAAWYRNELRNPETIQSSFSVDSDLIDSHLAYPTIAGMTTIPLQNTKEELGGFTRSMSLQLPVTHVERNTGLLYQTPGDARIRHGIFGSARKLYAPIWADLGDYEYRYASTAPIGVHDVTFTMQSASKYSLELYAYMYHHADTDTGGLDELLVKPIEQDEVPSDWPLGTAN